MHLTLMYESCDRARLCTITLITAFYVVIGRDQVPTRDCRDPATDENKTNQGICGRKCYILHPARRGCSLSCQHKSEFET